MKKYRSLAIFCALVLTMTGCKAQSVNSNSDSTAPSEATTIDTAEPVTSEPDTPADNGASSADTDNKPAYISTDHCLVPSGTLVDPEKIVDADSDIDQIELQSYTIGNDVATFTFDAPEGLEFEEQSSSIAEQVLFESYAYSNDDNYTIGAVLVDFDYTLGQPQELLDSLGFPGSFYITTEFLTEATDDGTTYDIILMALYKDEEKQELHSIGMMGCYPTEHGVLFFGYEMNSPEPYDDYYTIQEQTLDSLVISESDYTEPELPDEELPEAFQTVICEEQGCSFPVLKDFVYYEDADNSFMWSGMVSEKSALFSADYSDTPDFDEMMLLFDEVEGASDYYDISADYKTTDHGIRYRIVQMVNKENDYWERYFAIYPADIGSYCLEYCFYDQCSSETKALILESFKGFKITE